MRSRAASCLLPLRFCYPFPAPACLSLLPHCADPSGPRLRRHQRDALHPGRPAGSPVPGGAAARAGGAHQQQGPCVRVSKACSVRPECNPENVQGFQVVLPCRTKRAGPRRPCACECASVVNVHGAPGAWCDHPQYRMHGPSWSYRARRRGRGTTWAWGARHYLG